LLYSLQHCHHSQGQAGMAAASPSSAAAKMMSREHRQSLRKWSGSSDALIPLGTRLAYT